jgi:isopropylmalate/homocitrate/citramalate synthase
MSNRKSLFELLIREYGINSCNRQGVEVRFSSEDSFRSDLVDVLALYKAVYVGAPTAQHSDVC